MIWPTNHSWNPANDEVNATHIETPQDRKWPKNRILMIRQFNPPTNVVGLHPFFSNFEFSTPLCWWQSNHDETFFPACAELLVDALLGPRIAEATCLLIAFLYGAFRCRDPKNSALKNKTPVWPIWLGIWISLQTKRDLLQSEFFLATGDPRWPNGWLFLHSPGWQNGLLRMEGDWISCKNRWTYLQISN